MVQELAGSVAETLRLLATHTLDPRDETLFCRPSGFEGNQPVRTLEGCILGTDYRFHLRHTGDFAEIEHIAKAIGRNRSTDAYAHEWRALLPHLDIWLAIGRSNPWIRRASDPPFSASTFALCRGIEQMAAAVDRDNWSAGQAFAIAGGDICMIQQCDGPGEFLMVKGAVAFDSWTTGHPHIHGARLVRYLDAVLRAPLDSRGRPLWYDLAEPEEGPNVSHGVQVAASAAALRRLIGESAVGPKT